MRGNGYDTGRDGRIATRSGTRKTWRTLVPITMLDVVGSAVVALWLVYQPSIIDKSMALDLDAPYSLDAATSQDVNRSLKGNRLDVKPRQPAGIGVPIDPPAQGRHGRSDHDRHIRIGCDPAFSPLVDDRYFSGRCVTGIDSAVKLVASLRGGVS